MVQPIFKTTEILLSTGGQCIQETQAHILDYACLGTTNIDTVP